MALTNKPPFEVQLKSMLREATVYPNMLSTYQDKVDELTAKYKQEIILHTLAEILHAIYDSHSYELGVDLASVAVLGNGGRHTLPRLEVLKAFSDVILHFCGDDLEKLMHYLSRLGYVSDLPFE